MRGIFVKILEPSLLAADPGRLAEQMAEAELGGALEWHFDVMDGHFVPNLSFGPHVCKGLLRHTKLPINAHLMVAEPQLFACDFLNAGASSVVIHVETGTPEILAETLTRIRGGGAVPGIALNPGTAVEAVLPYLPLVDRVLLMSVEPGFGGQAFIPGSIGRLRSLRALLDKENPAVRIQLDGGVTLAHTEDAVKAGADILIAGSAVFAAPDIEARCREFTALIEKNKSP
jgi:ribulose-phosphate 3-epimerase